MKIGYIQTNPDFLKKKDNLKEINILLDGISADLLVLPEFFNTGYAFENIEEIQSVAEKIPDGETTEFLIELAKGKNIYIAGGLPEIEGEKYYNSSVLVGPEGYIGKYRKVHLYYKEKLFFERGNLGYPTFDIYVDKEKIRVGMLICFDWFFPEAMRTLALAGADIILHSTNLVMPYYQDASKVRALENRVFIILANRYGNERDYHFTGRSQIVNYRGEVLISSDEYVTDVKIVDINPQMARDKNLNGLNNIFSDI